MRRAVCGIEGVGGGLKMRNGLDLLGAGSHTVHWDSRNEEGGEVPSGVYFVCLHALGVQRVHRAILAR